MSKTFLFQAIQLSQKVLIQTIQFNISMQLVWFNPYIGPLSGATTPGQSGPGSNVNEGMLCIPQSSNITGTSPSDCLVSYPGHSLGESYPSAEVQLVYSTAPADGAIHRVNVKTVLFQIISVLFQIIQFSISTQFRCQNSSTLNSSV